MTLPTPSRDDLAERYFEQLPYEPYPVQEEALFAWFAAEQGVMVCAPTGTGKTLIAEAALFEALHTRRQAYYTTPLIALTEQKFAELQERAESWGFRRDDIGLVTGNRRVNPEAPILVVVAEILLNRLLHPEAFDFELVSAVVMDEFHSFNDRERGVVWELTLGLLPAHIRTLLISATVGNAFEFSQWLQNAHHRRLQLVQSEERKVPLSFHWVEDELLNEHIEEMAAGDEAHRRTPALIFCFNREECWSVAEQLKGRKILPPQGRDALIAELKNYDWSHGAGPKLKQILTRGVGVHHAGVLPIYRRIVEDLFQKKLLSIAVCTETLSAGINLPARSVVVPNLLKGPPDKKRLVEPSSAHQIFGRAGRPQFDTEGHVYVLAHEDDVRLARWKVQYDQIPDNAKDPNLIKAKKRLKKKMPKRRAGQQTWTEAQFEKLCQAKPADLESRGSLPWRLLAYMLEASPQIDRIRHLVGKRLMPPPRIEAGQRELDQMLLTLWKAGYVRLEPEPPSAEEQGDSVPVGDAAGGQKKPPTLTIADLTFGRSPSGTASSNAKGAKSEGTSPGAPPRLVAEFAYPTDELVKLTQIRSINPLYGVFLIEHLGIADEAERIQALESVLELPRSLGRVIRVPPQDELPPGRLAAERLDPALLRHGLATAEQLVANQNEEDDRRYDPDRPFVLTLAEKLKLLFEYEYPRVHDIRVTPAWAVGALMEFGGYFNQYVTARSLQKQEGIIFRHVLRMILLIGEIVELVPAGSDPAAWRGDWEQLSARLTEACREVDPTSTEKVLEQVHQQAAAASQHGVL